MFTRCTGRLGSVIPYTIAIPVVVIIILVIVTGPA